LSVLIFGLVYIAIPYSLLAFLVFPGANNHQYTSGILLGLLALIWLNDTGAYVFGMLFGKHRLFERISPKKSWEGAIGGTIVTIVLGYCMNFFVPFLSRADWIILSLLVSVFGVFGDLFESLLKRSAGVKDSGNLMPGHGGILDRMDSLLLYLHRLLI
jgi:phosphatidate cytidylyltransferase